MKRIILILGLFGLMISIKSQTAPTTNGSMSPNGNYCFYYKSTDVDSAISTTAKSYDFFVGKDFVYSYNIIVDADTGRDVSNRAFTVQVYGSDDDVNYYTVGSSQTWNVTIDTVMRFCNVNAFYDQVKVNSDGSTLNYSSLERTAWRFLRVTFTGANTTAKCYIHMISVAVFKRPDSLTL